MPARITLNFNMEDIHYFGNPVGRVLRSSEKEKERHAFAGMALSIVVKVQCAGIAGMQ